MPQFREKIIRDLHWVLESPNILRIDIEDCAQLSDAELLGGGAGGSANGHAPSMSSTATPASHFLLGPDARTR